jgi:ribosomal protein S8
MKHFSTECSPVSKKSTVLFEVSQILPAFPSDMGSIVISTHGMKDTDKEFSEESLTHCLFDNHKS